MSGQIAFAILFGLDVCVGLYIVLRDSIKMSVQRWSLLLIVLVGWLCVITTRVLDGTYSNFYLISPVLFIIFSFLIDTMARDKLLGKADLDLLAGSVSLVVPWMLELFLSRPIPDIFNGTVNPNTIIMMQGVINILIVFFVFSVGVIVGRTLEYLWDRFKKKKQVKFMKKRVAVCLVYAPTFLAAVLVTALM